MRMTVPVSAFKCPSNFFPRVLINFSTDFVASILLNLLAISLNSMTWGRKFCDASMIVRSSSSLEYMVDVKCHKIILLCHKNRLILPQTLLVSCHKLKTKMSKCQSWILKLIMFCVRNSNRKILILQCPFSYFLFQPDIFVFGKKFFLDILTFTQNVWQLARKYSDRIKINPLVKNTRNFKGHLEKKFFLNYQQIGQMLKEENRNVTKLTAIEIYGIRLIITGNILLHHCYLSNHTIAHFFSFQ